MLKLKELIASEEKEISENQLRVGRFLALNYPSTASIIFLNENRMNSHQAKQISLVNILALIGHEPYKYAHDGLEVWYSSPFREEKEASFKVETERNIWYDHGTGQGGNAIDFVMLHLDTKNIKEVLQWLNTLENRLAEMPQKETARHKRIASTSHILKSVKNLYYSALIEYGQGRGVSPFLLKKYLKQIHYTTKRDPDKSYFSLGFQNASGGYELRNTYHQGTIGNKDITFIRGVSKPIELDIFEGFFDFLSFLMLAKQYQPAANALILNSLSMQQKALDEIERGKFQTIRLWLDNDPAGNNATEIFLERLRKAKDCRHRFTPQKDLNEFLLANG